MALPCAHRFVTDVDAPLEQQLLHVLVGKQEAVVKVDRIRDDTLRKAVSLEAFSTLSHSSSPTHLKQLDGTAG